MPYTPPFKRLPFRNRILRTILSDMNDAFIQQQACRLQAYVLRDRDDADIVTLPAASLASRLDAAFHLLYPIFE
ncbi:hypothetical protein YSY43_27150 [Paenibacillus sp. YSY-4.3]